MKGKFDAYVLWPLDQKVQNWIVDRSTAWDFTVLDEAKIDNFLIFMPIHFLFALPMKILKKIKNRMLWQNYIKIQYCPDTPICPKAEGNMYIYLSF